MIFIFTCLVDTCSSLGFDFVASTSYIHEMFIVKLGLLVFEACCIFLCGLHFHLLLYSCILLCGLVAVALLSGLFIYVATVPLQFYCDCDSMT